MSWIRVSRIYDADCEMLIPVDRAGYSVGDPPSNYVSGQYIR